MKLPDWKDCYNCVHRDNNRNKYPCAGCRAILKGRLLNFEPREWDDEESERG